MKACPQQHLHTPCPEGSWAKFEAWATQMSATHKSTKCPGCGLYKIWIPKTQEDRDEEAARRLRQASRKPTQFESDQIEGLLCLHSVLKKFEVNCVIVAPGADMGRLEMVDTPRGPHAIYDPHNQKYDIWIWGTKRPVMKHTNLSVEDAAEMLSTMYFLAKAKRIHKQRRDLSIATIMETLRHGYQRGQTDKAPKSH